MQRYITRMIGGLMCLSVLFAVEIHAQMPNTLSNEDKVFGLSQCWQEANFNFVYMEKVDRRAWDSLYRSMIREVQLTRDDYEYYRDLQRFYAFLKDGHTAVIPPQAVDTTTFVSMFGDHRIVLGAIEGKPVVTAVNPPIRDEVPIGSEVVEVNGLSADEYLQKYVSPYISSSTDYVLRDQSIRNMLEGTRGQKFDIRIKTPGGKYRSLSLVHEKTPSLDLYPPAKQGDLLTLKWYKHDIAYVALNSFGAPRIDTLFVEKLPELYKAKGLILDLRNNGGGSTGIGLEILQYLTNDTLLYGSRTSSRLLIPAFRAWGKSVKPADTVGNPWSTKSYLQYLGKSYYAFDYSPSTVRLDAKRLVVPTAILIGHGTASAAEDFLIYADHQKHMVKIGENSFGSTGQPYLFDLPGGGWARVCTKKDTYPDGREFVGVGVKPDIEVRQSVQDFIDQRDPVLERALDYVEGKIR